MVYRNIIARTVNGGCCIHAGKDNVFENDVFVEGYEHQVRLQPHDDFMKGNKFVRNIVVYSRPQAQLIFSWRNQPDMFSECDHNLYWLKGADLKALKTHIMPSGTFAQWQAAGYDTHSLVADPLFVDAAHDDYRLSPTPPRLKLGFRTDPGGEDRAERIGEGGPAVSNRNSCRPGRRAHDGRDSPPQTARLGPVPPETRAAGAHDGRFGGR